jgi:hypothetical protein
MQGSEEQKHAPKSKSTRAARGGSGDLHDPVISIIVTSTSRITTPERAGERRERYS